MEKTPVLEIKKLHAGYGVIQALRGVDLVLYPGEVVTLIGSNGAGKSTLLMSICGVVKPWQGDIYYQGDNLAGKATYNIMSRGIAQVPEGRHIFSHMTVLENLQMGAEQAQNSESKGDLERVFELFPVLKERVFQSGGTLSGGEQQMLAIGRALMSRPTLLLLDEPSLGLAPLIAKQIFEIIREINQTGTSILLVEQNAFAALKQADRAYVLSTGSIVLSGSAQEMLESPEVQKAYLGG